MKTLRLSLLTLGMIFNLYPGDFKAQLFFDHTNEIPVVVDGENLKFPWAGGLNNPQFSGVDLNFDGVQDLFIYDRTSGKHITLLHSGQTNSTDYTLDFNYDSAIPELQNWVLLRDFNCDGKMDIFSHRSSGMKLHENTSTPGNPSFELRNGFIQSSIDLGGAPFFTGIFVSSVDVPAIDDIDGDGDLDILTFTQGGSTVELYLNNTMEFFGNCDSLAFDLANRCYGQFSESAMSEEIFLGDEATCDFNVAEPTRSDDSINNRSGAHSGSSICMVDTDQNGFKDLILGDISSLGLTLISIGASSTNLDSAFAKTINYPTNTESVITEFFPTGYYVDVDNDGIKDFMAAPSNQNESEDISCSYFFKNNGEDDQLDPAFQQNDFLVDNMIDVGTAAYPHLVDHNQDGKLDLIVSNKGYYQLGGDYISQLALFENTGTVAAPEFTLLDDDYLSLSSAEFGRYLYPTFGDLDGDGDEEMVLGNEDGKLFLFENTAGPGQTMEFSNGFTDLFNSDAESIDVGINATPQLFDLNEDGLLDLIVGERNGNINYYSNIGSETNQSFTLENDSLGGILTDLNGDFVGYGVPTVFWNNGEIEMLVGSQEGNIIHYNNISGNLDGEFDIITEHALPINKYTRPSPVVGDLNQDNLPDLIVGNFSGGLDLWMGGVVGIGENVNPLLSIDIFPNPADESFLISTTDFQSKNFTYEIFDITGKKITENNFIGGNEIQVNSSTWSKGIYIIQISSDRIIATDKVIISH